MKTEEEIQLTHDFLEVALREISDEIADDDVLNMVIMRDSLCWVLDHEENEQFEQSIALIQEYMYGKAN